MTPNDSTQTMTTAHTTSQDELVQFLNFTLGNEEYGLPILQVQEIKGHSGFTPIPSAPAFVKGVMNLRGAVVPVFDLRARFGLPAADASRFSVVIVVNVGAKVCGLVVDAVSEVVSVSPSAIEPPPELGIAAQSTFITGLFKANDRFVAVLGIDRVCAVEAAAA